MPLIKEGPVTRMKSTNIKVDPKTDLTDFTGNNFEFSDLQEIGSNMELYNKIVEIDEMPGSIGTTSMFNEYNVFVSSRIAAVSSPKLYDVDKMYDTSRVYRTDKFNRKIDLSDNDMSYQQEQYRAPTAARIIASSNVGTKFGFARTPYSWSDFLYCKYYGRIPNNQLITLRRYPFPVYDNLYTVEEGKNSTAVPVAQAVTWLGEETGNKLSDILKFSFGVLWEEIEPTVQDIEGNEVGFGAGLESILGKNYTSKIGTLANAINPDNKRWSGIGKQEQNWRRKAWSSEGPYWNQVYGPVNVVDKTYMRKRGLKFNNQITIKFHYSLRSINGVNPRIAMLDLITNFLSLTYTNAKWWGGSARYFPNYDDPVLFFGSQTKLMTGDVKGYIDSLDEQMKTYYAILKDKLITMLKGGLSLTKNEGVNGVITTALDMMFGKLARKSRPEFLSVRSLLSGRPIGEWHLTIGNPMNPIAVIGNLIVDDTEMELGDTLGADDFPTEITFTVKLKQARPRDKGDIESIFNYGQGQMSYSPLIKLPSESNTFGDDYTNDPNDASTAQQVSYDNVKAKINTKLLQHQAERTNAPTSEANRNRIRQRINTEWGNIFANSKMLSAMFENKQYKG